MNPPPPEKPSASTTLLAMATLDSTLGEALLEARQQGVPDPAILGFLETYAALIRASILRDIFAASKPDTTTRP